MFSLIFEIFLSALPTVYTEMIDRDEYQAQCNLFRAVPVEEKCDNLEPYLLQTPTTRISLEQVHSALIYNADPKLNGSGEFGREPTHKSVPEESILVLMTCSPGLGNQYIRDYGIRSLSCNASRTPVPGFKPPVYKEVCDTTGFDQTPSCKNFQNSAQLSEIAQSCEYSKRGVLTAWGYMCMIKSW